MTLSTSFGYDDTSVANEPITGDRWTSSAVALPENGESVEFVLEYRDIAMRGTFNDRVFRTRWSRYEPSAICEWRRVGATWA